ncbi:hypothetical protein BT67DRAFT_127869 [Trichocladium antarcticum]|uniref:Uncharacterized protein n=1 Tax=Trichocladium antarcticum TaxID=1450529 RepID=A0AAN6UUC7_9PEZI|nr:hypothetical protein BT67DRAFT_127869 [Trichocladium antarcticum]
MGQDCLEMGRTCILALFAGVPCLFGPEPGTLVRSSNCLQSQCVYIADILLASRLGPTCNNASQKRQNLWGVC